MIPIIDIAQSQFNMQGSFGIYNLDPSFSFSQSRGQIRQNSFRNRGQNFISYHRDQMKEDTHGPLILEGIINHKTRQEHLDFIIDLWQKMKIVQSITFPNGDVFLMDSLFYIGGYGTRELIDNSDRISKIKLYFCIKDTQNL